MNQNKINEKQNEDLMLKLQFAARQRYNQAEIHNVLIWGACILSALSVLLPQNQPWFFLVPLTFDVIAFLLNCYLNKYVSEAALLRGYFDAYVLNIGLSDYTEADIRHLKSLAINTANKHTAQFRIQSANTGKDTPPGVRDWYEISSLLPEQDAQYECQNQNLWWNTTLYQKRCHHFMFIIITVLILTAIAKHLGVVSRELSVALLCSAGILIRCAERISANKKYYDISQKIHGAHTVLQNHKNPIQLKTVQNMINERRAMPILESNTLHKKLAKQLTEKYHELIS